MVVPKARYLEEILIHRWALKDERHDGVGKYLPRTSPPGNSIMKNVIFFLRKPTTKLSHHEKIQLINLSNSAKCGQIDNKIQYCITTHISIIYYSLFYVDTQFVTEAKKVDFRL